MPSYFNSEELPEASGFAQRWSFMNCPAIAAMLSIWTVVAMIALQTAGIGLKAFLILATATVLIVPLLVRGASNRFDVFEPLVLANMALGAMFVFRPLADIATDSYIHLGYDIRPTFDFTLFVSFLGCTAFEWGYGASLGRKIAAHLPLPSRPLNIPVTKKLAAACFLVGGALFGTFLHLEGGFTTLLVFLGGRSRGEIGVLQSTTAYLYQGMDLFCPGALMLLAIGAVTHRRIYSLLGLLLVSPYLLYYTAQGDRSILLPPVIALLTFPYLYKGKRPGIGTLIVVTLIGISVMALIRQNRNAEVQTSNVSELSYEISQVGSVFMGSDNEMFDTLANVTSIIPSHSGFSPGGIIRDFGIRVVPRVVWPQKPQELNATVVGALWPELPGGLTAAMPSTSILGTLYADSWIIGVFAGMFVIGSVASTLWQWYKRSVGSVSSALVYAMCLPYMLVLLRGYPADTAARMMFTVLPLCVLGYGRMLIGRQHHATIRNLRHSLAGGQP